MNRRTFLTASVTAAAGLSGGAAFDDRRASVHARTQDGPAITIDPAPLFELSPYLFMQFMEPLGTTDPGVEAAWSYDAEDWRRDFVECTKDLAPPMMRIA